jgi:hypothetical protein
MNASEEIVTVVRNSSRDHHKYVNPFLANTLWFAAAAQCACKVFGPATFNKRLTSSNLDLLKLTIDRFILFYNGMENLKGKLARIEAGLKSLMASGDVHREHRQQPARSSEVDAARGSGVLQNTTDAQSAPHAINTTSNTNSLLPLVPGMIPNGWTGDPRWPSFVPDMCDFMQPLIMADGQNYLATDSVDFSPFGLEELLMAGIDHHI